MRPLIPPALRAGATIGVIAPASPARPQAKVRRGVAWLRRSGFNVVTGEHVLDETGYLAGTDADRAADLNAMLRDPSVDAVFCTRGGYGSMRLLPHIDYTHLRRHPKILMGFSDITALSLAMHRKTGLVSFAGPMVAAEMQAPMAQLTERSMLGVLSGTQGDIALSDPDIRIMRHGDAEGLLLGGNLAMVVSLLGTPYEPRWEGAVLFLEDVGEAVYRIDRMLCQLQLAGVLSKVRAVLLGHFTGIPASRPDRAVEDVFNEYFLPCNVPVVASFPFGHTSTKVTLPIGAPVAVSTRKRRLTFLGPVVHV